jgi:hypothetical protein
MDGPFGAPAGLLRRLSRGQVRADDLVEAVEELRESLPTGLRLVVVDDPARTPVLLVEEAGRGTRVPLDQLAGEMTRAHVPATRDGVAAALRSWLSRRPVPDAEAATAGIAVLDWTDAAQTTVGWRVVLVRDGVAVPWRPSRNAAPAAVHQVRSAALGRSYAVTGDLRVQGPVALWSHAGIAGLDTALLVRPEELLAEMADAGLPVRDVHIVVTPQRPVACADPGVARRLAAEASGSSVTLPWQHVADLGWV